MFKKLCYFIIISFMTNSSFLAAEIEYDIQDIGTLQTKESESIALNNQGQILGWYSIDGSNANKHFFVRNRDGVFSEIPSSEPATGTLINWRYLTDEGQVYGTFDGNTSYSVLYMWDRINGVIKLGNLPGKEVIAINNAGQVLIKSVVVVEDGKSVRRPIIWQNGQITKLRGAAGDLGIESDESYGFGMNNNGDVVGQSVVYLSHKNNIYKQVHAIMWIDGQPIDLHDKMTRSFETIATAITDQREVLIEGMILRQDGSLFNIGYGAHCTKMTSQYVCYKNHGIFDVLNRRIIGRGDISYNIANQKDSIWMNCMEIISVNDKGEAIAKGKTIYGEEHIMFLSPVKSN